MEQRGYGGDNREEMIEQRLYPAENLKKDDVGRYQHQAGRWSLISILGQQTSDQKSSQSSPRIHSFFISFWFSVIVEISWDRSRQVYGITGL
jgi:hypothetical protein